MPRPGSTRSRGYGAEHQRETARLKQQMREACGATCARGGEWLQVWQLDLPHTHPQSIDGDHHGLPLALGGRLVDALSCAHHNRQHGARLGNQARAHGGLPDQPPPPSRTLAPKTSRAW